MKLFLHLSEEEQRRRFLARIDEPQKNWKFSAADVKERSFWADYQKAFSAVLSNTSTAWAPWYVIPADDKPYARMLASAAIAHALVEIDPQYPKVSAEERASLAEARLALVGGAAEVPAPATPMSVAAPEPEAGHAKKGRSKGKHKAKGR